MSDQLTKDYVRRVLAARAGDNAQRQQRIAELESQGYRIVDGGQTGGYDDDGRCPWEVTDWRTREVLTSGHGTFDDYGETLTRIDPEETWFHIDQILNDESFTEPSSDGLPPSLAEALEEWADQAPDAEIASWTGQPLEEVQRQRAES